MVDFSNRSAHRQRDANSLPTVQVPEDVNPLSPSVSYGSIFISSLSTTGDIPIFLDSGISDEIDSESVIHHRGLGVADPLPCSSSFASTGSVGNLGLRSRILASASNAIWAASPFGKDSVDSGLAAFGYKTPTNQSFQYLSPEDGYYDKRSTSSSQFTISAYMTSSASLVSTARSFSGSIRGSPNRFPSLPSSDNVNRRNFAGAGPGSQQSSSLAASLSTIILAAGSAPASPSITSSLYHEIQAHGSQYRPNIASSSSISTITSRVEFPRSSSPFDDKQSSHSISPCRATFSRPPSPAPPLYLDDTMPIIREGPRLRTKSASTTRSNESGYSTRLAGATATQTNPFPTAGRSTHADNSETPLSHIPRQHGLPLALSWLEHIRLEVWIDQEGFRLIRPVFEFAGYSCPTIGLDHCQRSDFLRALVYGSAEFRPVEHQSFIFHQASLEPPPTLRKLTMENDESRDYMTRQASLTVKSNGVYSVCGSELFDGHQLGILGHPISGAQQKPYKLNWRFEYSVDDCYVEFTGKTRPSEKILTPLSFLCSPGLVHPSNGKKIKLMQVFKKGLTPKLSSAKVDAGQLPSLCVDRSKFPNQKENMPCADESTGTYGPINMHRRAYSSSVQTVMVDVDHCRHRSEGADEVKPSGIKKSKPISFVPSPRSGLRVNVERPYERLS